jgi:hypothetical protein
MLRERVNDVILKRQKIQEIGHQLEYIKKERREAAIKA